MNEYDDIISRIQADRQREQAEKQAVREQKLKAEVEKRQELQDALALHARPEFQRCAEAIEKLGHSAVVFLGETFEHNGAVTVIELSLRTRPGTSLDHRLQIRGQHLAQDLDAFYISPQENRHLGTWHPTVETDLREFAREAAVEFLKKLPL